MVPKGGEPAANMMGSQERWRRRTRWEEGVPPLLHRRSNWYRATGRNSTQHKWVTFGPHAQWARQVSPPYSSMSETFFFFLQKAGREGGTKDEMVGWHHWLNGHEFEQAPGDSEGQGSLMRCSPWGFKELGMTQRLNNSNNILEELPLIFFFQGLGEVILLLFKDISS